MKRYHAIILALIVLLNLIGWTLVPENVTPEQQQTFNRVKGFAYAPFQRGQTPVGTPHYDANDNVISRDKPVYPTEAQIDSDLAILAQYTDKVRTYGTQETLASIPKLARKHGMRVTMGSWISRDEDANKLEVERIVKIANENRNIDDILVGNEVLLRGDLHPVLPKNATPEQHKAAGHEAVLKLASYIKEVRSRVLVPVSTAEDTHTWLAYPELADAVNHITVHILPYWEGKNVEEGLEHVWNQYFALREKYPNKRIVIGEVGWPSAGEFRRGALPGKWEQEQFIRSFIALTKARGDRSLADVDYFICEAFDQPWKAEVAQHHGGEGGIGAYWGLFDADRNLKFDWTTPSFAGVSRFTQWTVATAIGLLLLSIFFWRRHDLAPEGLVFFGIIAQFCISMTTYTGFLPLAPWLTTGTKVLWIALFPAQILMLAILLINAFEMTELLWIKRFRRMFRPLDPTTPRARYPKVSIHIACCNEPPEMVIKTVDSVFAQTYPNLEILVIDNNTKDPKVWMPVKEHCDKLGAKVKFFHLDPWPGFKAGALNFAMDQTAPDAEVVGVIDADYIVEPDWLRSTVPYFDDPSVGLVQAPQSHRAWKRNAFKEAINWEYEGFFHIGMVHRNEYNAIIQHGTMCLMRKEAMEHVGRWSEWCIVEDAEMGLKLMKTGYRTVYINYPFGQGLVPDSFIAYKKQRFRWAYGAIQILRKYWTQMLPGKLGGKGGLTNWQRYHFLAGWLPWFGDALHLVFTFLLLAGSAALIFFPRYFMMPVVAFLLPALLLSAFNIVRSVWLYQSRVPATALQRFIACVAGLGLTYTIGRAVVTGVITKDKPFFRTPKCQKMSAITRSLMMVREELGLMLLLWGAILGILWVRVIAEAMNVQLTPTGDFTSWSAWLAAWPAHLNSTGARLWANPPTPVWLTKRLWENPQALVWVVSLMMQSIPYVAAVIGSVVAGMPTASFAPIRVRQRQLAGFFRRAFRWATLRPSSAPANAITPSAMVEAE